MARSDHTTGPAGDHDPPGGVAPDADALARLAPADLLAEADRWHAAHVAAFGQLLATVAELDRREVWRHLGVADTAALLSARYGVRRATAMRWIDMARTFASAPATSAAIGEGRLSLDQIAPVARLLEAEPSLDGYVADEAPAHSPTVLSDLANRHRPPDPTDERSVRERQGARIRFNSERTEGFLSVRAPAEVIAEMSAGLDRWMADRSSRTGPLAPLEARRLEALREAVTAPLAEAAFGVRALLAVHVSADEYLAGVGGGDTDDGIVLSMEAVRRLGCDGSLQLVVDGPDGQPWAIGRTADQVPRRVRRLVRRRDRTCRFPGCGRARALHLHHVVHRADLGPSVAANVAMLCWYHHGLVHEGRWTATGDAEGELVFEHPSGFRWVSPAPGTLHDAGTDGDPTGTAAGDAADLLHRLADEVRGAEPTGPDPPDG